jgi:RNA polymerase sigma-B factor
MGGSTHHQGDEALPRARPGPDGAPPDWDDDEVVARIELWFHHLGWSERRDPADRRWLVEHYSPLAERLARRMYRGGDLLDDLQQVAYESLLRSLVRFDPERGPSFEAFATPTILGALKRYYRDQGWALRVPRQVHEQAGSITDAVEALTQRLGGSPTPQQVADELGIDIEVLLETQESMLARRSTSLDFARPGQSDHGAAPVVDPIAIKVDQLALRQALTELSGRDRELLDLSFSHRLSQAEIAERFGVSQMQVSRWMSRAVSRLRDRLVA